MTTPSVIEHTTEASTVGCAPEHLAETITSDVGQLSALTTNPTANLIAALSANPELGPRTTAALLTDADAQVAKALLGQTVAPTGREWVNRHETRTTVLDAFLRANPLEETLLARMETDPGKLLRRRVCDALAARLRSHGMAAEHTDRLFARATGELAWLAAGRPHSALTSADISARLNDMVAVGTKTLPLKLSLTSPVLARHPELAPAFLTHKELHLSLAGSASLAGQPELQLAVLAEAVALGFNAPNLLLNELISNPFIELETLDAARAAVGVTSRSGVAASVRRRIRDRQHDGIKIDMTTGPVRNAETAFLHQRILWGAPLRFWELRLLTGTDGGGRIWARGLLHSMTERAKPHLLTDDVDDQVELACHHLAERFDLDFSPTPSRPSSMWTQPANAERGRALTVADLTRLTAKASASRHIAAAVDEAFADRADAWTTWWTLLAQAQRHTGIGHLIDTVLDIVGPEGSTLVHPPEHGPSST